MGTEIMGFEHSAALQNLKVGSEYLLTHSFKGTFSVTVEAVTVNSVSLKGGGERETVWVHGTRVGGRHDRPTRALRARPGDRVILMGLLVQAARRGG